MRDIEAIALQLSAWRPDVVFEQLRVQHPGADDDGVWFVRLPENPMEGSTPFPRTV